MQSQVLSFPLAKQLRYLIFGSCLIVRNKSGDIYRGIDQMFMSLETRLNFDRRTCQNCIVFKRIRFDKVGA